MIIGIDVDEVCADMLPEWVRRYNRAYDDTLKVEDITAWDMTQFVKPECGKDIYRLLQAEGFYHGVKPIPRALESVKVLRQMGHRVVFVSSCVRLTLDMKLEWLVRHEFLPRQASQPDFIACADKTLAAVDLLIDDHVKNVEDFPGYAVLVTQPHNARNTTEVPRIPGLWAAPAHIALRYVA